MKPLDIVTVDIPVGLPRPRTKYVHVLNRLPTADELHAAETEPHMVLNVFGADAFATSGLRPDMSLDEIRVVLEAIGLWPSNYHAVYVAPDGMTPAALAAWMQNSIEVEVAKAMRR